MTLRQLLITKSTSLRLTSICRKIQSSPAPGSNSRSTLKVRNPSARIREIPKIVDIRHIRLHNFQVVRMKIIGDLTDDSRRQYVTQHPRHGLLHLPLSLPLVPHKFEPVAKVLRVKGKVNLQAALERVHEVVSVLTHRSGECALVALHHHSVFHAWDDRRLGHAASLV